MSSDSQDPTSSSSAMSSPSLAYHRDHARQRAAATMATSADRKEYLNNKLQWTARLAMNENAVIVASIIGVGLKRALRDGGSIAKKFKSISKDGNDDTTNNDDDIPNLVQKFAIEAESYATFTSHNLSDELFRFLSHEHNAKLFVVDCLPENGQYLSDQTGTQLVERIIKSSFTMSELDNNCQGFTLLGKSLYQAAEKNKRFLPENMRYVHWSAPGTISTLTVFGPAAAAAVVESAVATGKILQGAWEKMEPARQAVIAGGGGAASGISQGLCDMCKPQTWEDIINSDGVSRSEGGQQTLNNILGGSNLNDFLEQLTKNIIPQLLQELSETASDILKALQHYAASCFRAGLVMFETIWEAIQEAIQKLVEAGKEVYQLAVKGSGSDGSGGGDGVGDNLSLACSPSALDSIQDTAKSIGSGAQVFGEKALEASVENTKIVGEMLQNVIKDIGEGVSNSDIQQQLPEGVIQDIELMAKEGIAISGVAMEFLKDKISILVDKMSDFDITKFQQAIMLAVQAGVTSLALLWDQISTNVIPNMIDQGRDVIQQTIPNIKIFLKLAEEGLAKAGSQTISFISAAAAAAIESTKLAGKLLLEAIESLIDKINDEELLNSIKDMANNGKELVGTNLEKLKSSIEDVIGYFSDSDSLDKLRSAVSSAASAGINGMLELWQLIKETVESLVTAGTLIIENIDLDKIKNETAPVLVAIQGVSGDVMGDITAGIANAADFLAENVNVNMDDGLDSIENVLDTLKGVDSDTLESIYTASREETLQALNALQGVLGGLWALIPVIKLEVFRDVFQVIGMFFSKLFSNVSSFFADLGQQIWGFFGALINIDWGAVIDVEVLIIIGIVVLCILGLGSVCAFCWFISVSYHEQHDSLREGHEAESWKSKKASNAKKVRNMSIILLVCLSIYLPIARICIEILYCDFPYNAQLYDAFQDTTWTCSTEDKGGSFPILKIIAIFFLIFFVIPLPCLCVYLIEKNKPVGSPEDPDWTHDEDGMRVPFTDDVYANRIESDPEQIACPYRTLYQGFERKFAYYKILMMLFKFILVMPLIYLAVDYGSEENYRLSEECLDQAGSDVDKKTKCHELFDTQPKIAQPLVTLCVVGVFALFSTINRPFIDPIADIMDGWGRVTMTVTCGIALIYFALSQGSEKSNSSDTVVNNGNGTLESNDNVAVTNGIPKSLDVILGSTLHIFNFINFCIMSVCLLYGFPSVRNWVKNKKSRIDFSNTCTNVKFLKAEHALEHWDIELELKHRIWHAFWNSVLLNGCGVEVAERMLELKENTRNFGLEKIQDHWEGFSDPIVYENRQFARQNLEGVDLYWDDGTITKTLDGNLDSNTFFGKMYIDPYPFHMVMVYDDCDDVTFLWGADNLQRFIDKQKEEDVVHRVTNRRKIRALDASNQSFYFPFERQESETVQDGYNTVHYTDNNGNSHTRQEPNMITVTFTCYYKNGQVSVSGNTNKQMCAGFKALMDYYDGYGKAYLPKTQQWKEFHNRHACMGHSHMGITNSFMETDRMKEFFEASEEIWNPEKTKYLGDLLKGNQEYRKEMIRNYESRADILGDGFWYYVYNNMYCKRKKLETYFQELETNPVLKSFNQDHRAGLDFLYLRMQFINSSERRSVWYCFWDDFWAENCDMVIVKPHKKLIDPMSGQSIIYSQEGQEMMMMSSNTTSDTSGKEKLKNWLMERGLYNEKSWFSRLIDEKDLDRLYTKMGEVEGRMSLGKGMTMKLPSSQY